MLSHRVGRFGAAPEDLRGLRNRLARAKRAIVERSEAGEQGWLSCLDDAAMVKRIRDLVKKKAAYRTCLVIGIGGSDLAARALSKALKPGEKKLVFAGANTDPDELAGILSELDLRKTLINVISKSGDTVEPMATFLIVRDRLERRAGKRQAANQIIATTDRESGSLRELAEREGYDTLPVPKNIGGRFSALTDVGLFPLAYAGADMRGLLAGGRAQRDAFLRGKPEKNPTALYAALQYLAYLKRRRIHVLMPYAERLREFAFWYRQLWAESLGKKTDRRGNVVHVGPTPVAALGVTDQHSQLQLYVEGPNDKIITCIEVGTFDDDAALPDSVSDIPSLAYLKGKTLQDLIHAERKATVTALARNKRPNGTVHLPNITAETMGELIVFFELATAMMGELLNINAYHQPGVEEGKRLTKQYL
ncbi:glucose-6-phosphate isomerase [Candidatus Uhrbacteria bacterium]|nr:glucose-6-phosphate isomerase [Candidatus Uhrbacteria bacterium]